MTNRTSTNATKNTLSTSLRIAPGGNGSIPTIHELIYGENKLTPNIAARSIFITFFESGG